MNPATQLLVQQLREFAHVCTDGGAADPYIEVMGGMATQAADAIEAAEGKADRFRDLLHGRPANNASLPQSYVEWSSRMYLVDANGHLREPKEMLAALRRQS